MPTLAAAITSEGVIAPFPPHGTIEWRRRVPRSRVGRGSPAPAPLSPRKNTFSCGPSAGYRTSPSAPCPLLVPTPPPRTQPAIPPATASALLAAPRPPLARERRGVTRL